MDTGGGQGQWIGENFGFMGSGHGEAARLHW